MKKVMYVSAMLALCAFNAKAIEVQPYVGIDYVHSGADMSHDKIYEDSLKALAVSAGVLNIENMGFELSYQQSEQAKKNTTEGQSKTEYKSYGIDGVYYLQAFENLYLLGGAGLGYYEINRKLKNTTVAKSEKDNHWGLRAGVGVQFNLDENWALRGTAKYHFINSGAIKHMIDWTAGIRYFF